MNNDWALPSSIVQFISPSSTINHRRYLSLCSSASWSFLRGAIIELSLRRSSNWSSLDSTISVFSIVKLILSSCNDQLSPKSLHHRSSVSIVEMIFSPFLGEEYWNFLFIRRRDGHFPVPRRTIIEFSFHPSWQWSFLKSFIENNQRFSLSILEIAFS